MRWQGYAILALVAAAMFAIYVASLVVLGRNGVHFPEVP